MDRAEMSHEENYCFDISGYLVLRGVLTPREVEACNSGAQTREGRDEWDVRDGPHRKGSRFGT